MSTVIHAEVIVVGALTGGLIGFFWHPIGAVAALAVGALLAVGPEAERRSQGQA